MVAVMITGVPGKTTLYSPIMGTSSASRMAFTSPGVLARIPLAPPLMAEIAIFAMISEPNKASWGVAWQETISSPFTLEMKSANLSTLLMKSLSLSLARD